MNQDKLYQDMMEAVKNYEALRKSIDIAAVAQINKEVSNLIGAADWLDAMVRSYDNSKD